MRISVKSIILAFLMLVLSLSVATNSLNSEVENSTLEDTSEPLNVILPLANLNVPGFQESSIYTNSTFSSGAYHSCAILDDGTVSCWGRNNHGQLGDGTTTDRNTPTQTSSLGNGRSAVAISAGYWHTCAILDDGSVSCWGNGGAGRLGDGTQGDRTTPTQTASLGTGRTAVAIVAGIFHTCVILDDGTVSCWGDNDYNQIGDGTNSDRLTPTQTASLGTNNTAVAISAGEQHTCVILNNGTVSCWGTNTYGQLGDGTSLTRSTPTPTSSLGSGSEAVAITSGSYHICTILDNGTVSCWGRNNHGQLGDGTTTDRNTPTQTSSLGNGRTAVAISAGYYHHACALLDDNTVTCWGDNTDGRLGDGTQVDRSSPTQTSSLGSGRTGIAITSGSDHSCVIIDNGTISCWGNNDYNQIGDGTNSDRLTPTQTSSLGTGRTVAVSERDLDNDGILNIFDTFPFPIYSQPNVLGFQEGSIFSDTTLSSGSFRTCALLDDGTVSCWGTNTYGQLGDGTNSARSTPTQTSSLGTGRIAVAISAGNSHTCAILDDGTVSCWGRNNYGQLGDGTTTNRNTPNQTSSLGVGRTAVAISSGSYHTCAILDDGTVSCWGDNYGHQLGDGTFFGSYRNIPNQTSSLGTGRTAVAISAGNSHTCAILDDASVSCWGDNYYGQLGDGTNSGSYTPTQTSSLGIGRIPVAISSGVMHTCAILDDASVSCWGRNNFGQLGDGTYTDRNTPTQTSSLGIGRIAVAISSGYYHTCAVLDNASVSCWGYNNDGGLGDGTNSNRSTPTQTSSLGVGRTAVAISSGNRHTCALLDDASVSCWGRNSGNLGDGTTIDRNTPTQTSSLGTTANPRTAALSERDFDGDGVLNIYEGHIDIVDTQGSSISSGHYHTCTILDNGSVSCWGQGTSGELGNGATSNVNIPTLTSTLGTGRTAVAISSGLAHTCAILDNGEVSCWGDGIHGQLGNGGTSDKTTPTLTSSLGIGRTAVAISAGAKNTCVILDNGAVSCWGNGYYAGNGGTSQQNSPALTSSLGTGRTAVAISSGNEHTCVILDNGSVSCWGSGTWGQIGDGASTYRGTPTLTSSLGTNRTAVAISSGASYTCVTLDNGSASCWGSGTNGQLGNGGTSSNTPVLASSFGVGRTAQAIASSADHTCAILDNGSVSCWGHGYKKGLGNGNTNQQNYPSLTSTLGIGRTAFAITAGSENTCVILDNRSISCWGSGTNFNLGHGGSLGSERLTPSLTSSLGPGRTATIIDGDLDGDGFLDHLEDYPNDSVRSISCSAGQFGRYTCINSPSGKYVSSTGSMYATDASSGHYVQFTGQSSQTPCIAGTYNPNTVSNSSLACMVADAGYYVSSSAGSGQSTQTSCLAGTYNPNTGSTNSSACEDADPGHYVSQVAQINQTECGLGTYQPLTGQSSCDNADVGHYVQSTGQSSQTPCIAGTYNPYTGTTSSSVCIVADAGYYVSSSAGSGQSTQTACLAGTYNPNTGSTTSSSCGDADAGHYVSQVAQITQTECGLGTYQPLTGQSSCDDADAGYYVSQMAQTNQTECGLGTYQHLTGQSSCDDADAGYYVDQMTQTNQTECGLGTYQPLTGQISCDDADAGYYVDQMAQTTQTECGLGTYQPLTGQISCDDADAGHYVSQVAQTNQTECGLGTYQPLTGQISCDDADAGYYVDQMAQTNQTECGLGTYQHLTGQSSCDDADAGYYVDQMAQTIQTECALGTYQPLTGQASCGDADAGHYVDMVAQTNQTECGLGTYQPLTGQSSCDDADAGHYVDMVAQTNQTECGLGTYQPLTGQSSCDDADAGHYVDLVAQTNQTECGLGTYQPLTGQSSCDDADAGFYVNQMSQTTQTECELGAYQPLTGQSSCGDADAGYFVSTTGQSSQTECGLGTYQPLTGQSSCDDADAGNYVSATAQLSQLECGLGTYQPLTGQSSCDDADAGHYVDLVAQTNQTECGLGTYQQLTGQDSCDDADAGHYVDLVAQTNQTACLQGTFNPNVSSVDVSACVPCPNYTSTLGHGSESITACMIDTDSDGNPDLVDLDDDNDGTLDDLDAFPLDDTENTDTDGNGVGDNLQAKQEAKLQKQILSFGGIAILLIAICAFMFFKRKSPGPESTEKIPVMESKIIGSAAPQQLNIVGEESLEQKEIIEIKQPPSPRPSAEAQGVIGGDGYEWITFPPNSQTNFYRAPGDKEWILWEN